MTEYDVFLSHNSADKEAVEALARRLQEEAGLNPFLDQWHLIPGEPWQEALEEALDLSATVAVILGSSGVSPWHNEEMRAALDARARDKSLRVIPILLPGASMPERGEMPRFLYRLTWVDFRDGLDDPEALHRLVSGVRGVAPGPGTEAPPPVSAHPPYRGLEKFRPEDAEWFFGRESETQQLVEKLKTTRFLAVLGPSGSGKSSVVLAGLVPALARDVLPGSAQWPVIIFSPTKRPLEELALRLAQLIPGSSGSQLLRDLESGEKTLHLNARQVLLDAPDDRRLMLAVDQFEEAFTQCKDVIVREQFFANLLYATDAERGRATVVLTMRADFLAKSAEVPALADRLAAFQFLVTPMVESQLRDAIQGPAARAGLELEPGLADVILGDVADQPGGLPLLEHALCELWKRRQGRLLTFEVYREIGGVAGALARTADATYQTFDEGQRKIARRILLDLVQPGEGTEDTRRRAKWAELVTRPEEAETVDTVLRCLADERLVTTGQEETSETPETVVNMAHEALIRNWPRLQGWINQNRESLLIQRRLRETAEEWDQNGRDQGYLYRGARLAAAEEWAAEPEAELPDLERAFLEASRAAVEAAEREKEALRQRELEQAQALARAERQRAEEQAWATKRLRRFAIALAVVLAFALGAGVFAAIQWREAKRQANLATARQLAAQALNNLDGQLDLALLLDLEANRITSTDVAESRGSLLRVLEYSPKLTIFLHDHTDYVWSVAFSPDGKTLASGSEDGTIILWDVATSQPIGQPLDGHGVAVYSVAFSPDGKTLASGGADNTIILWDVATSQPLAQPLTGHSAAVYSVAFSPDGETLASGGADNTVILWNTAIGQAIDMPLTGHSEWVWDVAFSPDGKTLASGSKDDYIILWDVASGQALDQPLAGHDIAVVSVAFSPDGRTLASGGADNAIILWDVATHQPLGLPLVQHTNTVWGLAFSPDGETLASGSQDASIILWNVATRQPLDQSLTGHSDSVAGLTFSPDGKTLASGSWDKHIILWDLEAQQWPGQPFPLHHAGEVQSTTFSPDGQILASGSRDGTIILWDATTRQPLGPSLTGHTNWVWGVTFSPDGKTLASGDRDGTIILWDAATGQPLGLPLTGHEDSVRRVAFSPDGKTLASAGADSTIRLWDAVLGQPLGPPLTGHKDLATDLTFSPDGKTLASSSWDHTVILWDVATGQPLGPPLTGHTESVYSVAFSPDGKTLASGSRDSTIILWDVDACQPLGKPLIGHAHWVYSVAFSPDGKTLASGSRDRTIMLWDVETRQRLGQAFVGHSDRVWSVDFSPDGLTLISGGGDGNIVLWDVNLASWQARACGIANRNLSPSEWEQYLEGKPHHKNCPTLPIHPGFIEAARDLARAGNVEGAVTEFQQILELEPSLDLDPMVEAQRLAAQSLIDAGRNLAREGNIEDAITQFQQALDLDPGLDLDPETEARQVAAQSFVDKGRDLAREGDIEEAVAQFQRALELDPSLDLDPGAEARKLAVRSLVDTGRNLAREGNIEDAVIQFQQALELNPDLDLDPEAELQKLAPQGLVERGQRRARQGQIEEAMADYAAAQKLDPTVEISTSAWDTLCWFGSVWGYATDVIDVCEQAVELAAGASWARDSRGLARALTGDYPGAIEDFKFVVERLQENDLYEQGSARQEAWLAELKAGRNPFDEAMLEELRPE